MNLLWAIAMLVVSYAITYFITPRSGTDAPVPAGLDEFDFPQFDEGTPQTVYFGDCNSDDWFVLWYGNYRTEAITAETGGK